MAKRILIKNPLVVATMNDSMEEFSGGHILIENNKIVSAGENSLENVTVDETIDASKMVVLPGFINTHHHLYQTLTRNLPKMQDAPLFQWLVAHYEVWRNLTEEAVSVSAKTGILEMMKSGVTTTSDHFYLFPEDVSSELIDAEIDVAKELGIRFQPTRGSMSLGKSNGGLPPDDVVQTEDEIMADVERLIDKYHDANFGAMVRISLAPCSPFSVTPELMKQTAEFAKSNNLQIHTHLCETIDEENFCVEKYGKRPVEYLDSLGWISDNSWFAHMVHLNKAEIEKIGNIGVGISHCPTSNMRLGSGIARIREMLDAGVNVSLGVDGSASNDSSNMLSEIRNAMLISRLREEQFWLSARDVLKMATRGGAAVLGRTDIGEISVGKCADFALFSMDKIEYAGGMSDPLASLVFSNRMSSVDFLIINGQIQIRDGKNKIDEQNLIELHNKIASEMLELKKVN